MEPTLGLGQGAARLLIPPLLASSPPCFPLLTSRFPLLHRKVLLAVGGNSNSRQSSSGTKEEMAWQKRIRALGEGPTTSHAKSMFRAELASDLIDGVGEKLPSPSIAFHYLLTPSITF